MATYNKFNQFVEDLCIKVHNISADQLEWYLSNATPDPAADAVKADLAEIATGNGYTGPVDTQNTGAETGGTYTATGTAATVTASGTVATFRYVVLQNTTPTSPLDPLIAWHDYGAGGLSLLTGETFTIKPNNSASTGTLFTVA